VPLAEGEPAGLDYHRVKLNAMEVAMDGKTLNAEIQRIAAQLQPILSDETVWEVMVDSYDQVLVSRGEEVEQVDSPFSGPDELQELIDELFGLYGIKLDTENPIGYLRLPDFSRVMAIVPPNAVAGPHLVLRRIIGKRPSWEQLIEWESVPQAAYDLLKGAVKARMNLLVAGGTGSGKTTLASRIVELFPPAERVIIVENAYEMVVDHPRVVRLEAGGRAGLSVQDVVVAAGRMRPDRLVIGNLHGPAAATVLQYFGMGYDGGLTHIHGTSVDDALKRLESFCLMADMGLGLPEIRHLIASGIQLITYQEHLSEGKRKIVEIVELRGVENHRYVLQPLMRYDRESKRFGFLPVEPQWEK
jgi:pilus assembly protein CpaF